MGKAKMRAISVEEAIENWPEGTVYLDTAWGMLEVECIRWPRTDPWAFCPKANGGFGRSFCVHYGTRLYVDDSGQ